MTGFATTLNAPTHKQTWHALLIGESPAAAADQLRQFLSQVPNLSLTNASSIPAAITAIDAGQPLPDLLIVLQAWPDQHVRGDCERLLQRVPLARSICCCAAWCESEGRNCQTWPDSVRVPLETAIWRLKHEIRVLQNQDRPLPITAGRDESFAFRIQRSAQPSPTGAVSISTTDRELRSAYEALLRSEGWDTAAHNADVILFDIDPWNETTRQRGLELQGRAQGTPIVGWSYWSHHIPEISISEPGDGHLHLAAVASKLWAIDQLTELLHSTTPAGGTQTATQSII